jgi:hypothetical protein
LNLAEQRQFLFNISHPYEGGEVNEGVAGVK